MRISIRMKVFAVITATLAIFSMIFLLMTTFFSFDFFLMDYKKTLETKYEQLFDELQKTETHDSYIKNLHPDGPSFITILDENMGLEFTSSPLILKERKFPNHQRMFFDKLINKESNFEFLMHNRKVPDSVQVNSKIHRYKSLILVGRLPKNYYVLIERPLGSIDEAINMSHHAILWTGLIAFVVSIFVSYFFSYILTKPIYIIRKVAASITKLKFDDKVEIANNDELGDLGNDINSISEKLELTISDLQSINFLLKKDKAQLLSLNTKLEKASETDTLTQLSNRLRIDKILERLELQFNEQKRVFSIILMDIDYFKKINDTYGHPIGDIVLKQVSSLLQESSRAYDEVGRWGGEEFIIILFDTSLDGARIKAENIRKLIENFEFDSVGKVTCSLGVSEFREDDDMKSLMKRTDDRLYKAKQSGRNRVIAD